METPMMGVLVSLLVGLVTSFIVGRLMKYSEPNFIILLMLGVVGSYIGGHILYFLGIDYCNSFWRYFYTSLIGAGVVLGMSALFIEE